MYKILLVEDDKHIREAVLGYFQGKGKEECRMDVAKDGLEGLYKTEQTEYDLLLLDVMLPKMDGFELCREIRRKSIVPIIFLTAKSEEEAMLAGYGFGADDYMIKPFSMPGLYAKVMAMLKRSSGQMGLEKLQIGGISMIPACMRVQVLGEEVDMTPKMFALLRCLMENKGIVLSRDILLEKVWGWDYVGTDRVVDNHVKKLRKALKQEGSRIKTIFGKGYRMEEDET